MWYMKTETIVEIDAAASRVWSVLADVTRWPEWTPTMNQVRLRGTDPLGPSSTATIRQPKLPPAVWKVTAFEDGHRFAWTAKGLGFTTVGDHVIEPLDEGRCRVTLIVETTGPLAGPFWRIAGDLTQRYVATEAASLKKRCEA
jgi:hypothetical protein